MLPDSRREESKDSPCNQADCERGQDVAQRLGSIAKSGASGSTIRFR